MPEPRTPTTAPPPLLNFTADDLADAHEAWGCNCGPSALAACLGWSLERVRPLLGDFESRRYMNAGMMRQAVERAGCTIESDVFHPTHGLIRVQLGGPWTAPGANGRWASMHTHWIASKRLGDTLWAFDVNSLWTPFDEWERETLPLLVAAKDRADGTWTPTHLWEVRRKRA